MPALNATHPRIFRSYDVARHSSANCRIWEAARATTAVPSLFERALVGDTIATEEFIGGIGCSNSTFDAIEEAMLAFGDQKTINTLMCIGSGKGPVPALRDGPEKLPDNILAFLTQLASESVRIHQQASSRFKLLNMYFRLDVGKGLDSLPLDGWGRLGEVSTHTQAYLRDADADVKIDALIGCLLAVEGTVRLENLSRFPKGFRGLR